MKCKPLVYGSCLAILVAVVCGIIYGISTAREFMEATVRPRYAIEWTSVFIVEHLRNSNNRWPTGWEDLRNEFESMADPGHYAWTFDELQTFVDVRWTITLPDDREWLDDSTNDIVSVKHNNEYAHMLRGDLNIANQEIREYLRQADGTVERR